MRFTVAIDGPAAAGKGTISKGIATHFGFVHLDTGLLYRAVGRRVLAGEDPALAAQKLTAAELIGDDLRTPDIARVASQVAVIIEVREALLAFQREFARRDGGAVLDGRDIGTVICPDAEVKIFVTASAEVRAGRRHKELISKGNTVTLAEVFRDVAARDARDSGRAAAPTKQAEDALLLDTSEMSVESALAAAVAIVQAAYLDAVGHPGNPPSGR